MTACDLELHQIGACVVYMCVYLQQITITSLVNIVYVYM